MYIIVTKRRWRRNWVWKEDDEETEYEKLDIVVNSCDLYADEILLYEMFETKMFETKTSQRLHTVKAPKVDLKSFKKINKKQNLGFKPCTDFTPGKVIKKWFDGTDKSTNKRYTIIKQLDELFEMIARM